MRRCWCHVLVGVPGTRRGARAVNQLQLRNSCLACNVGGLCRGACQAGSLQQPGQSAVSKLLCWCNAVRSSTKGQSAPVAYMLRLAGSDSGRLVTSVHTCGCWMGVVGAALLVRAGVGAAAPDRLHSVTVCRPDSDPLSPCWAAFPSLPRCSHCHGLRPVTSAGAPPVC